MPFSRHFRSTREPQGARTASTCSRATPDYGADLSGGSDIHATARVPNLIVLTFDRQEIESGDTSAALGRLRRLSDSATAARQCASRTTILVCGYAEDLEWSAIPACRTFFRRLASEWDGWLYFLEKEGSSISILLSLLLDWQTLSNRDGIVAAKLDDVDQLGVVLTQLFGGMKGLYARLNLTDPSFENMANQVARTLDRLFPED